MHLWCFLFFCFLISRINKLHFLDTGCENAKLWFQFKGCVTASRHNSAARIRTLALCSHILMSGRPLSCSPLTLVPHEDSAAEINLPDVGVEGEVPLRGLVVREPPIDLHQLHIVTVWNTWNIWKNLHKSLLLTAGQLELADVGVERVAGELHVAADHRHVAPGQGTVGSWGLKMLME